MDREKLITDLEKLIGMIRSGTLMDDRIHLNAATAEEIVRLIKEREPAEIETEGGGSSWWHVCGECHGAIDISDNFCKHCGRRIIHEEKAK